MDDGPMAQSDIAEIMGALGRLTAQVEQLRETGRDMRTETAALRGCVTRLDAAITALQDDEDDEPAEVASTPLRLVMLLEKNPWLLPVMLLLGALLFGGGALVDLITRAKP